MESEVTSADDRQPPARGELFDLATAAEEKGLYLKAAGILREILVQDPSPADRPFSS